ncbi:IS4 family transposase [uncultured Halomonas sp.]|uniref:IS4 family transposase n=1 Tax=uncultured Halomonas sp. TaxID=173971 RepID=UPI002630113D|nr:IS4 family transposase [uncultured Halomonas sp.]
MTYPTDLLHQCQQRRVAHHASRSDHTELYAQLHATFTAAGVEQALLPRRHRLFPPAVTLEAFIAQALDADASCQQAVNRLMLHRARHQQPPGSVHTGAYCRARQRLPGDMVADLTRHLGHTLAANRPAASTWQGRPIKLIDGTTVSMPDTPENQQHFPQPGSQQHGLGFPMARLVAIMDMSSGAVLNVAMGPLKGKGTGEHALLREMLDTFEAGDIVIADRYYPSYALVAELVARGVDVVMRQHFRRDTDFQTGESLGHKDHIAVWEKPKNRRDWMSQAAFNALPKTLSMRELAVGGMILITTLCTGKVVPRQQLKELYQMRWQVELRLRDIKTTLGMDWLRCKTPAMVEKEVWVYLLAYNLIRRVMVEASDWADCLPQQLSFKHSVQIFRQVAAGLPLNDDERRLIMRQITLLRVGRRPGRVEPRALKRRPSPHPLLKTPRHVAREQIRQHGHPKKLK